MPKKLLLLGSGELGKELVIEAKRFGLEVIAIDKYKNAPAMQIADFSIVIDMSNKEVLSKTIKEFIISGALGQTRTGTPKRARILSPLCLPISPRGH